MTTIRQLIQTSPVRANELFARLSDTSDTAVKTREKLFSELKAELELLTTLEDQHLFPVLRKHTDLKELVRDAVNDNKVTRKLLSELDATPKESPEFGTRVAELRHVFQQHVRDEKKELLPAVLKALTDDEADGLVERFEAGKAEIQEAKRADVEERRTTAGHQSASTESFATETIRAAGHTGTAVARHLQDASNEYLGMVQERFKTNLNGMSALMRCRTLPELWAAQGALFRDNLELTLRSGQRLSKVAA